MAPIKAQAYTFTVGLPSQAGGPVFQASPTLAAGDVKVSKDGAAAVNLATLPTAAGKLVTVALTATEMDADRIDVIFSDQAGDEWADVIVTLETDEASVEDLAFGLNTLQNAATAHTATLDIIIQQTGATQGQIGTLLTGQGAMQTDLTAIIQDIGQIPVTDLQPVIDGINTARGQLTAVNGQVGAISAEVDAVFQAAQRLETAAADTDTDLAALTALVQAVQAAQAAGMTAAELHAIAAEVLQTDITGAIESAAANLSLATAILGRFHWEVTPGGDYRVKLSDGTTKANFSTTQVPTADVITAVG